MPSRTTRQEARKRLQGIFEVILERCVPADESVPLKGRVFRDFEEQAMREGNEILAALMEERAKLDGRAIVEEAGRCPLCESLRTYLEPGSSPHELLTPAGAAGIEKQNARCRACGASFSPSVPRLESTH